jgi:hypothetical protein
MATERQRLQIFWFRPGLSVEDQVLMLSGDQRRLVFIDYAEREVPFPGPTARTPVGIAVNQHGGAFGSEVGRQMYGGRGFAHAAFERCNGKNHFGQNCIKTLRRLAIQEFRRLGQFGAGSVEIAKHKGRYVVLSCRIW